MSKIRAAEEISYTIFIAGDHNKAVDICQEFCISGFCVTCEKTKYIYTMGAEDGVRVGIINYARFPSSKAELREKALSLAHKLLIELHQGSFSVVGGGESIYFSRRAI